MVPGIVSASKHASLAFLLTLSYKLCPTWQVALETVWPTKCKQSEMANSKIIFITRLITCHLLLVSPLAEVISHSIHVHVAAYCIALN